MLTVKHPAANLHFNRRVGHSHSARDESLANVPREPQKAQPKLAHAWPLSRAHDLLLALLELVDVPGSPHDLATEEVCL